MVTIQAAWRKQHWQHPILEEVVQPDKVILTLKTISLIPNHILNGLKIQIGEKFSSLSNNEILALAFASQYENVTNINLQNYAEINAYESNKILSNLVNKKLLLPTGSGRGMKYIINYDGNYTEQVSMGGNELSMGGNELSMGGNDDIQNKKIDEIVSITIKNKRFNSDKMLELIVNLCTIKPLSAREISNYLNRDLKWIKSKYISKLVKEGRINLLYPDNPKNPNQKYYVKNK